MTSQVSNNIQPSELQSTLLPYQRRAVAWMLHRELIAVNNFIKKKSQITLNNNNKFDNNYDNSNSPNNDTEMKKEDENYSDSVNGGILADEMGLGTDLRSPMKT